MTKKHFEALAAALKESETPDSQESEKAWVSHNQWKQDCWAVARVCQQFNNNFDRERFLDACGYYG